MSQPANISSIEVMLALVDFIPYKRRITLKELQQKLFDETGIARTTDSIRRYLNGPASQTFNIIKHTHEVTHSYSREHSSLSLRPTVKNLLFAYLLCQKFRHFVPGRFLHEIELEYERLTQHFSQSHEIALVERWDKKIDFNPRSIQTLLFANIPSIFPTLTQALFQEDNLSITYVDLTFVQTTTRLITPLKLETTESSVLLKYQDAEHFGEEKHIDISLITHAVVTKGRLTTLHKHALEKEPS